MLGLHLVTIDGQFTSSVDQDNRIGATKCKQYLV